jgi:hypothetical protein
MIELIIYSRPGCHLCSDMKALVYRVVQRTGAPVRIDEVDIDTDPELEARFGTEIPVLLVNGKKAAKFRVSEQELARLLVTRADDAGRAG